MPSHPFGEHQLEPFGRNAAVEFAQVALEFTPCAFNMVRAGEVTLAVVPRLVGVAQKANVVVASMTVGDYHAGSCDVPLQKTFQAVLFGVRDNLEAEPPGIPFNGANDNSLPSESFLAEVGLVDLDNPGQKLCSLLGRYECPEPPVPASNGGIAQTRSQTGCSGALSGLPTMEQREYLLVAQIASPEPSSGFRPHLDPTGPAPAIFSFPRHPTTTQRAVCLVGKQLVNQLLTPGFAR